MAKSKSASKKAKAKAGRLVMVFWDDSASSMSPVWGARRDEPQVASVRTAGFVGALSRRSVNMLGSVIDPDGNIEGRFAERMVIPRGAISAVRKLSVGRKMKLAKRG